MLCVDFTTATAYGGAMDVLVVTQGYPSASDPARAASLHASVKEWRTRGQAVTTFVLGDGDRTYDGVPLTGGTLSALSKRLSETAFHRLVLHHFDEQVAHALDIGWRCQATPIVMRCGDDAVFPDAVEFSRPYFTREPHQPANPARRAAYRRYAADPRVTWVFRSRWHQARARELLGLDFEQSLIIPRAIGPEFTPVEKPADARFRLVFSRRFVDECRHAVDVFVQTIIALSKQPGFERFDVLVLGDGPRHEALLAPIARFPNVRIERGFLPPAALAQKLADRGVALLPTRYATQDLLACQAAAAGLVVVSTARGGVTELLPVAWNTLAQTEDALEYAAIVQRLASSPGDFVQASRDFATHVATKCNAAETSEREASLVFASAEASRPPGAAPRPALTVTVPAYNAGHQLARCVESLTRLAPAGSLEVLVVDDGSTDDTPLIARAQAERWPGVVRVITQPNKGHGGAVNTGLREAKGRYFRVVDADDWVDSLAFAQSLRALDGETTDILLTDYAEVSADDVIARRVDLFSRLPVGATTWFDTLTDPTYGLTSWGPVLSTATYRTEPLRQSGLQLTEHSAYVDMEYCTLGLTHLETLKYLGLDVYRYSLGRAGQSVSAESYRQRYRQHEAVIFRLCDYVRDTPLSDGKRRYIVDRVLLAIIGAHYNVLDELVKDPAVLAAFEARLGAYDFLIGKAATGRRKKSLRALATATLKAMLPPVLTAQLAGDASRSPGAVARQLARYLVPAGLLRSFGSND